MNILINFMNLIAYHLIHLEVDSRIPLKIIRELFKSAGISENFDIYHLITSGGDWTTVFDYPVEWNKEQCVEFMKKMTPKLHRLNQMFSEKGMRDLATKIATT